MAEIEKITETLETPKVEEEVVVEIVNPEETKYISPLSEALNAEAEFYKNIAVYMDERTLQRISKQLVDDYKRDKISRKDWEQGYTNGLDLLGFKYQEMTRPFKGSASVTHPLLAEAVTQFQAQAYKN